MGELLERPDKNSLVRILAASTLLLAACGVEQPTNPSTVSADDRFYQDYVGNTWSGGSDCLEKTNYSNGRYPIVFRAKVTGPDEHGIITVRAWDPYQKGYADLQFEGLSDASHALQAANEYTSTVLQQNHCQNIDN